MRRRRARGSLRDFLNQHWDPGGPRRAPPTPSPRFPESALRSRLQKGDAAARKGRPGQSPEPAPGHLPSSRSSTMVPGPMQRGRRRGGARGWDWPPLACVALSARSGLRALPERPRELSPAGRGGPRARVAGAAKALLPRPGRRSRAPELCQRRPRSPRLAEWRLRFPGPSDSPVN